MRRPHQIGCTVYRNEDTYATILSDFAARFLVAPARPIRFVRRKHPALGGKRSCVRCFTSGFALKP
jgi:hypothetical protein